MLRRALAVLVALALIAPGPSAAANLRSAATIQTVTLPGGTAAVSAPLNFSAQALPIGAASLEASKPHVAAPALSVSPAIPVAAAAEAKAGLALPQAAAATAGPRAAQAPTALSAVTSIAASAPEKSGTALNKAYDASSHKADESSPVLGQASKGAPRLTRFSRNIAKVGLTASSLVLASKAFAMGGATGVAKASESSFTGLWITASLLSVGLAVWGLNKWHTHRQNKRMEKLEREIDDGTYKPEDEGHVFHGMGPGVAGNSYPGSVKDGAATNTPPVKKTPMLEDVAGQDEAKLELEEIVDFLKNPAEYKKLHPRYKGPKGVLVFGPPGTGKTLLARAVANEADVPFVHRAGSDFINTYVGKGADNIREAFKEVRNKIKTKGGAGILFIDEIEAIGGARTGNSDRSEETRTINALLKEMDGFEKDNIIVIAATNMPESLDPALVRGGRFGTKIPVGLPDIVGRKAILDIHLKGAVLAPDVDAQALAKQTPGLAGADLEQIVMDSVKLAKRRKAAAIGQEDLIRAIDEFTTGRQRRMVMSESDKRIVAYHESGHAIVSHLLPDADKVRKVTIIPHGLNALGFMQSMPDEEKVLYSYEWLLDRIAVSLGGRVAEKMMTGRIYSGAQNDLQQATRLAKHMVMQFGMSDTIGHVSYDLEGARPAVGRPMSEATNRAIDAEVKRIIEEQLKRVETLLTENRAAVQTMGDELMEKETLRSEDMERIIAAQKAGGSDKK